MYRTSARLKSYLASRYPAISPERVAVQHSVQRVSSQFIALGLADADFESELCSGNEARFWQRYTEAVLACEAVDAGLSVVPSRNGPDLCIEQDDLKIWVEFICPEPNGIPRAWLEQTLGFVDYPHTQMLLRWTAAIKEKSEKLLSRCGKPGYLAKGIVGADDCYVIAVNGRLLRGEFASLTGISQFPFAVEAVFAVGAYQLHIDGETLKLVRADHQSRPMVRKSSGAEVPTYTFLDQRFAPVSAIWATDFDDCSVVGNPRHLAVVHNPLAVNPLPRQLLPSQLEYVATRQGNDEYLLEKVQARGLLEPLRSKPCRRDPI